MKTFISIIRHKSLRIILAIKIILKIILIQIDILEIYLKSALSQNEQSIYIKIPQTCLISQESLIDKILKSLYGLKQVRRL